MGDYDGGGGGGACAAIYLARPERAVGPDARDCEVNESRLLMQMRSHPDAERETAFHFHTFGACGTYPSAAPFIRLRVMTLSV